MKYLMWLLKAAIFFTLFAFALNNQQSVAVYFFFGTLWKAPLVIVVLAAFASGLALGVLVMTPRWWKKTRPTRQKTATPLSSGPAGMSAVPVDPPSASRHGI